MSIFQGTPGPWTLDDDSWVTNHRDISASTHGAIAIVLSKMDDDYAYYFQERNKNKELEDNANLIAAAPELLECLAMALEWIDAVPSDTKLPTMPGFDRDYVNEVFSKALGEN